MKATRVLTSKFISFSNRILLRQFNREFSTKVPNSTKSKWQNLRETTTLEDIAGYSFLAVFTGLISWGVLNSINSDPESVPAGCQSCDLDQILGEDLSRALYRDWASSINFDPSNGTNSRQSEVITQQLIKNIHFNLEALYKSAHNEAYNYPNLKLKASEDDLKKLKKISDSIHWINRVSYCEEASQRKVLSVMSKRYFPEIIAEENAKLNSDKEMEIRPSQLPYEKKTYMDQITK